MHLRAMFVRALPTLPLILHHPFLEQSSPRPPPFPPCPSYFLPFTLLRRIVESDDLLAAELPYSSSGEHFFPSSFFCGRSLASSFCVLPESPFSPCPFMDLDSTYLGALVFFATADKWTAHPAPLQCLPLGLAQFTCFRLAFR